MPRKTGTLTIPAFTVTVAGKKYDTQPISINVSKGAATSSQGSANPNSPSAPKTSTGDKDLFLSIEPSAKNVYVGQQLTVEISVFTRADLRNINFGKDAEFKNMWTEKIFEADRMAFTPTSIGGLRYNGMLLRKVAAFPLAPGESKIEPMEITCTIVLPPRSFFDFGRTENVVVRSNPVKINVKSLPSAGKPPSFVDAVGKYTFATKADRAELLSGEAVTVSVFVGGTGNIDAVTVPEIKIPADFERIDKLESVDKKPKGELYGGTKKIDFILVPRNAGEYTIPAIEFSYFDPSAEKYVTLSSQPINIKVGQGKAVVGSTNLGTGGRSGVVTVGKDIEFIKPDLAKVPTGDFAPKTGARALWFLPIELAAIILALVYRRRQEHLMENYRALKASKALKAARKKLTQAQSTKDFRTALGMLYDAIFGYLGDKLSQEPGAVIFDEATHKLEGFGVQPETLEQLKKALDTIDAARFAPDRTFVPISELVTQIEELLAAIDKAVR